MADKEPHAVVRLLLARMESHPEEFTRDGETYHARWYDYVEGIKAYGNEADNAAIAAKLRDIRMGEIHEYVMDELLNGPERRRKAEEEVEYERQMVMQGRLAQQKAQQNAHQNQYANQLGQSLGQYSQAQALGLAGQSPNILPVANGTTGATLSTSTINTIKKALKL